MRIDIAGKILRDKDDIQRRNYESFVISAYEEFEHERFEYHIQINNYAVNAKSPAHKMQTNKFKDLESANLYCSEKIKEKLARNRVVKDAFAKTVDFSSLNKFLVTGFKISMERAQTIKNDIQSAYDAAKKKADTLAALAARKEEYFEEKIKSELKGRSVEEVDAASSFGKNAKDNPLWGLF